MAKKNKLLDKDYSWLRDSKWPSSINNKIIKHLDKENQKCDQFFAKHQKQIDSIYKELKGRIQEKDSTVPIQKGKYFYYSYIKKGQDYWIHARKSKSLKNKEKVLLNENIESLGKEFYKVESFEVSPNHKFFAYCIDTNGSEKYEIEVREISTNKVIDRSVKDTFGNIVWHADSKGFYYVPTGKDWRAEEVCYHKLLKDSSEDVLVYKEIDKTFWLSIEKSSSEEYLFIHAKSGNSNEIRFIDFNNSKFKHKLIYKRQLDHIYTVTHYKNHFYIITNDKGKDGRLVITTSEAPSKNWQEVIAYQKGTYLINVVAYKKHLVIEQKVLGLTKITIIDLSNNKVSCIDFESDAYEANLIFTTYDSNTLRYRYSTLAQPNLIKEYDFDKESYKTLKTQEIPSGFDGGKYLTKRIWSKSDDGIEVPITILYRKDLIKPNGQNPLYLYGYGSYGIAISPSFRTTILSLIDRGFIFAIAHIRGGDDLGYEWYESAKFLNKKRTFEDFISSAKTLIKDGYTSAGNITICGGSAGGMLIGYCINNYPHLYKAAILHVPFVDVLATMLDNSLPLTQLEFKEWGNPIDPEFYNYIKSYSPFDNIMAQDYPNIFITSGLNDPRVTYWEPAKFADKLRDLKTDDNLLLLKTNMSGGHKGKSGRYDYLKEIAQEYVFILSLYNNRKLK